MYEEQTFQVTELSQGEITGQHGLSAFLTTDTHTNMGRWGKPRQTQLMYTDPRCHSYKQVLKYVTAIFVSKSTVSGIPDSL